MLTNRVTVSMATSKLHIINEVFKLIADLGNNLNSRTTYYLFPGLSITSSVIIILLLQAVRRD